MPSGAADLSVAGAPIEVAPMSFSAEGNPTAELVSVANIGCEAADYPAEVSGAIALISRGTCAFAEKVSLLDHASLARTNGLRPH